MKARHLGNCFEDKVLTFWLLFRSSDEFILPIVRHCTAHGCSNRSNKVGWENLSWHRHHSKPRFCHMARAGTTEHLNMLFFGKICVWRYCMFPHTICLSSLLSLLIMTQNASLPCAFTWKLLKCRLDCNNCYYNTAFALDV